MQAYSDGRLIERSDLECAGLTPIVDAHHHVWDGKVERHTWLGGTPGLQRAFALADYAGATASLNVVASVLVQVLADERESVDLLHLAGRSRVVRGVVGFVDLRYPGVGRRIDTQRAGSGGDLLVGLRQAPGEDCHWFERSAVCAGLEELFARGLVFDLLVRPSGLRAASRLAARFPAGRFVLDHGANPDVASGALQPWADDVAELATHSNVRCKISGLATWGRSGAPPGALVPYVHQLVRSFGYDRLLFGSDWPVCTRSASIKEVVETTTTLLAQHLAPAQLKAVFGANAIETYGLCPDASKVGDRLVEN